MKQAEKSEVIASLNDRFSRARIAIVTECAGMPVNQVNDLRKKLRQANARMHVVKNTMAIRALGGTTLGPLQPLLRGQSALVIGFDDPVLPAKVLRDFIKNEKCEEKLQVKGGFWMEPNWIRSGYPLSLICRQSLNCYQCCCRLSRVQFVGLWVSWVRLSEVLLRY